jgi:hypothetical protein
MWVGSALVGDLVDANAHALAASEMDAPAADLTDDHMRLLAWLDAHPTGSLTAAAQALDLAITDVEGICGDPAEAEMIERGRVQ